MSDSDAKKFDLSEQDQEILANLRRDAQFKRGFPLAMIAAALSSYHMKRVPNVTNLGKFCTVLAASIAGNVAGTLSYFPTARKRMLEELPDDSELRKMLEEQDESVAKKNPPFTPHHVLQQREKNEFPQLPKQEIQIHDEGVSDQAYDAGLYDQQQEAQQPDAKISYEQLRMKSRNPNYVPRNIPEQLEGRPNNEEFDYLDNQAAEPVQAEPKRFVRYNKYGDEILD